MVEICYIDGSSKTLGTMESENYICNKDQKCLQFFTSKDAVKDIKYINA